MNVIVIIFPILDSPNWENVPRRLESKVGSISYLSFIVHTVWTAKYATLDNNAFSWHGAYFASMESFILNVSPEIQYESRNMLLVTSLIFSFQCAHLAVHTECFTNLSLLCTFLWFRIIGSFLVSVISCILESGEISFVGYLFVGNFDARVKTCQPCFDTTHFLFIWIIVMHL